MTTKLGELKTTRTPKILAWGPPGSGKTAFWTTLGDKCEILDLDNGLNTALTLDDEWKAQRQECNVTQCLNPNPNVPQAFRQTLERVKKIQSDKEYSKVLVVDSLTTLVESGIREILKNRNVLGKNPEIQDWGALYNWCDNLFAYLQILPVPVVVIAHEYIRTIDDNTEKGIAIKGQKLGPNHILPKMDEIWYFETKRAAGSKILYTVKTRSTGSVRDVRSRMNVEDGFLQSLGAEEILKRMGVQL